MRHAHLRLCGRQSAELHSAYWRYHSARSFFTAATNLAALSSELGGHAHCRAGDREGIWRSLGKSRMGKPLRADHVRHKIRLNRVGLLFTRRRSSEGDPNETPEPCRTNMIDRLGIRRVV